jgi:hypothetical protein
MCVRAGGGGGSWLMEQQQQQQHSTALPSTIDASRRSSYMFYPGPLKEIRRRADARPM